MRLIEQQQRLSQAAIQSSPELVTSDKTALFKAAPILALPNEVLTHVLSYILADRQGSITLRSAKDRRWRNELQDLVSTKWARPIYRSPPPSSIPSYRTDKSPLLEILLVCKAFYFAGIASFFGDNVLRFDNLRHLERLAGKLDVDRRCCIRRIEVDYVFRVGFVTLGDCVTGEDGALLAEVFDKLSSLQSATLVFGTVRDFDRVRSAWLYDRVLERFENMRNACGGKGHLMSVRFSSKDV